MQSISRLRFTILVVSAFWLGCPIGFGAEEGNPLIVPGQSVGEIKIGMAESEVFKHLGESKVGDAAGGKDWAAWFGKKEGGGRGYELDIRTAVTETSKEKVVRAVRVESPFFHTVGGISASSSLADIWKAFPRLHYDDSDQGDKAVEVYKDNQLGIAFEVRRTSASIGSVPPPGASWGACQAVIVFKATSANDENGEMGIIRSMRSAPDEK